jgi:nitrile hydratase accessory protein
MSEKGNFSWKEFVEVFGESLKKQRSLSKNLDGSNDYFSCWLNALEEILIIKKVSNKDTLMLLKEDWTQAYLSTPHGKPVNIKNRSV